jgi:hypothetical protein
LKARQDEIVQEAVERQKWYFRGHMTAVLMMTLSLLLGPPSRTTEIESDEKSEEEGGREELEGKD